MTDNLPSDHKPRGPNGANHRGRFRRNDQAPKSAPHAPRRDPVPDQRARGTAHQMIHRYETLAREAATSGDTAQMHYYLQHAEHYLRALNLREQPEGLC